MPRASLFASLALLLAVSSASAQPAPALAPSAPPPLSQSAPGFAPPAASTPPILRLPPWYIAPPRLAYDDGEPIPAGYTLKTRAHRPLIVAGAVTFGSAYLVSALAGATAAGNAESDGASFTPLLVPCLGPFIAAATVKTDDVGQFWLVLDGATQSAGAAMLVAGLLLDQKYLERAPAGEGASLRPSIAIGAGTTRFTWHF